MNDNNSTTRYSGVAQALHWLTAILVLVAFIYGPGGSETRVYSDARDFDRSLHETLGLAVFILSIIRLAWRAVTSGGRIPFAGHQNSCARTALDAHARGVGISPSASERGPRAGVNLSK